MKSVFSCTVFLLLICQCVSIKKRFCSTSDGSGIGVCTSSCSSYGAGKLRRFLKASRTSKCGPRKVCCPLKIARKVETQRCDNHPGPAPKWLVKIVQGGRPICSGSLIGSDKVLTAAMCVNAGAPVVSLGNQEIRVENTFLHPDFSPEDMSNNIAILQLERQVTAPLPGCFTFKSFNKGHVLHEVGWGTFEDGLDAKIKDRELFNIEAEECGQRLNSTGIDFVNFHIDHNTMSCLGTKDNAENCVGDLGGPLLSRDQNTGEVSITGVRTVPLMCGAYLGFPDFPSIFADLGASRGWVKTIMN